MKIMRTTGVVLVAMLLLLVQNNVCGRPTEFIAFISNQDCIFTQLTSKRTQGCSKSGPIRKTSI